MEERLMRVLVELGIAFGLGKTCIGLQTDLRRLMPLGNNPMVSCALCRTFSSVSDLVSWSENITELRVESAIS